jgi:uncharacterized protein YecE (DUF72 family)
MYIGTAAWNIPRADWKSFPEKGSVLKRYSQVLNAVEINSSFYKDHMARTYEKWKGVTPDRFRFSVKLNQRFTHKCDLKISSIDLLKNLEAIHYLDEKWRVLLLQFPASQKFYRDRMEKMLEIIRRVFSGIIAIEARNISWASEESIQLMNQYHVSKVIADPEKCPGIEAGKEKYYRLHGSPEIYRSSYSEEYLSNLYIKINMCPDEVWCIFDNTTFDHATTNALTLKEKGVEYERRERLHDNGAGHLYLFDEHR